MLFLTFKLLDNQLFDKLLMWYNMDYVHFVWFLCSLYNNPANSWNYKNGEGENKRKKVFILLK